MDPKVVAERGKSSKESFLSFPTSFSFFYALLLKDINGPAVKLLMASSSCTIYVLGDSKSNLEQKLIPETLHHLI